MNIPTAPVVLDPDEFLAMPEAGRYELIDGVPKERPVGAKSDEIAGLRLTPLNAFIRPRKVGRAYPSQTGYHCFPDRPELVRFPDVSFVATDRLPDGKTPDGYFKIAPDLAVESTSPNELCEEVEEKLSDYHAAGVERVRVVNPGSKAVQVRRADGTCALVRHDGELSGEDAVPGFACKVAELFV